MNCPICKLRYNIKRDPLMMPCGHSFCLACLYPTLTDAQRQQSFKLQTKCKTCQKFGVPIKNQSLIQEIAASRNSNVDKFIKICFFGNSAVGKSSLIRRMSEDTYAGFTVPTIGFALKIVDFEKHGLYLRYQMWDSAGQEKYKSISPAHYKNSDFAILVYDTSVNVDTHSIDYWFEEVQKHLENPNLLVIGNKTDMLAQNCESNLKFIEEVCVKTQQHSWKHFLVSCKTGEGINKLWQHIWSQSIGLQSSAFDRKSIILDSKHNPPQLQNPQSRCRC